MPTVPRNYSAVTLLLLALMVLVGASPPMIEGPREPQSTLAGISNDRRLTDITGKFPPTPQIISPSEAAADEQAVVNSEGASSDFVGLRRARVPLETPPPLEPQFTPPPPALQGG
ncbi:hypothetical protein FOZ62_014223 [Perkinsus olseni]|uniref:Uncharacterized protein n=1 Tax=Perkinsus olseni TaxID=32597 RepID=A0A7J6U410_PEROL|nr:hypothetical protein FOZ62_014223 [Perkinsus olseni]